MISYIKLIVKNLRVQKKLLKFIQKEQLFNNKSKLLVAVSGGVDSMVLLDVLHQLQFPLAVAHCNFKLRDKESDNDELFVKEAAKKLNAPFFSTSFDTAHYAKTNGISTQMAARDLRYNWFEKLRKEHKYELITTAHHQDDNLETILLNLIKGTALRGLSGISPKNGKVVRPLLPFTKNEILEYANTNKLQWREDVSNTSKKYERNKIRLEVIPILKEMNPRLLKNLSKNTSYLRDTEHIYANGLKHHLKSWLIKRGEETYIPVLKILKTKGYPTILYEYLNLFGFNATQVEQIIESFDAQAGKQFLTETHQLIKDRKFLILSPKTNESKSLHLIDIKQTELLVKDGTFTIKLDRFAKPIQEELFKNYLPKTESEAKLHYNKIAFPIRLRRWQKGDFFYPFGMKRKKKKLSDFFTNLKLSILEKEKVWILEDDKKRIMWVVGYRIDDRFAIHKKIKQVYYIKFDSQTN